MSSQEQVLNNGQQAHITTDLSKIFIWGNKFQTESYNNAGYEPVILLAGTVMGRIHATGKIVPLESDATDGSEIPLGILNESRTVEEGETVNVSICIAGHVAEEQLVLTKDGDTLDTVISSRRLRDRINADTMGIKLVTTTENTGYDNQ